MAETTSPVKTLIFKSLPLAEKFFLAGVALGLVLYYSVNESNIVFISLSALAAVYFLYAHVPPELVRDDDKPHGFAELLANSIVPKVMWISASVSIIGLLFALLKLEGSPEMLLIAVSALGVGLLLFTIFFTIGVKGIQSNVRILFRVVPIFIIDLYLMFVK